MGAIAAIYHRDGAPLEDGQLRQMLDVLAHRGADGHGVFEQGALGLGSRVSWTTRPSRAERMPWADPSGQLAITADARLDNRDELWSGLGRPGRPGDEVPDSRLILDAYERWGVECPRHLLGDFAFLIWDGRRRSLFGARDPMGVKPFFYALAGRLFVAASEIKGILQVGSVSRELDEGWIADYLADTWLDKTATVYRAVRRLAPAHTLVVTAEGVATHPYWELDPARELHLATEEDYAAGFRELFLEAVRCRLQSPCPVGSLLSGGMDSSSITCTARHLRQSEGGEPLPTFSALFPQTPQADERDYIEAVLAPGGLEPHCFDASDVGTWDDQPCKAWHYDQPMTGYNGHIGWFLLGRARELGVRVMLDGTDGDSTVSYGNGNLRELALGGHWGAVAAELRGYRRVFGAPPFWKSLAILAWRYQLSPRVPQSLKAWRRAVLGGKAAGGALPQDADRLGKFFNPGFVRRVDLPGKREQLARYNQSATAREDHWKRINSAMLTSLFECLDHMGAAFGIEQRFPYSDRRLVEYCLALPTRWKVRGGLTRYIVRRALGDLLPEKIASRPGKADLTPVFNHCLQRRDVHPMAEILRGSLAAIEPYVNVAHLQALHQRVAAGQFDVFEDRLLWRSLVLCQWLNGK